MMKLKVTTFQKKYPLTAKAAGSESAIQKILDAYAATPKTLELVESMYRWGYCRPFQVSGRDRWTKVDDRLDAVKAIMGIIGDEWITSNDAPRGEKTGDIIALGKEWVGVMTDQGQVKYHAVGLGYNTGLISEELFLTLMKVG